MNLFQGNLHIVQDQELRASEDIWSRRVREKWEEKSKSRACDVEWRKSWSDCAAAVFACAQTAPRKGMCGLHFLPPPLLSHTHTPPRLPTPTPAYQKKNKGRKYSKRSALIYCHFSEGDSDSEDLKKSNNNNTWHGFLWGFKSALVLPFKSDTGGRNGLSLVRRREKEEWRYGETEGVGMGLGGSALHSDEIKWRLKCWLIVFRPFITCSVTQALQGGLPE